MCGHLLRRCSLGLALSLSSPALAEPARSSFCVTPKSSISTNSARLARGAPRRWRRSFSAKAPRNPCSLRRETGGILAVTIHSLETISPTAQSWELPAIVYSVPPGDDKDLQDVELNRRTREAVQDALTDPRYAGKTIVMSWEHKHIADSKLEAKFPSEQVTLRQLLHLDKFADAPKEWPGGNYDYFWIVDFTPGKPARRLPHGSREFRSALRRSARR